MKLSVAIPVFNEEKTVERLISLVLKEKTPKEIIIVNDASTDGTAQKLAQLKKGKRSLKVISHEKNQGKGAAIRTAMKNATGDILIIQDADLEYDPKYYQELLKPIASRKTKVVYGCRFQNIKLIGKDRTILPLHYLVNRLLSAFTNFLYGSQLTDMETCYKMMTREIYRSLDLVSNRFDIEPEITAKILKAGHQIIEVPITTKPRGYKEGKKIKARDAFWAVWTLLKYWR